MQYHIKNGEVYMMVNNKKYQHDIDTGDWYEYMDLNKRFRYNVILCLTLHLVYILLIS